MANGKSVQVPASRIRAATKLRDELDSLIETAEILNDKRLAKSIRRSEEDVRHGRFTRITTRKELDDFFKK